MVTSGGYAHFADLVVSCTEIIGPVRLLFSAGGLPRVREVQSSWFKVRALAQ